VDYDALVERFGQDQADLIVSQMNSDPRLQRFTPQRLNQMRDDAIGVFGTIKAPEMTIPRFIEDGSSRGFERLGMEPRRARRYGGDLRSIAEFFTPIGDAIGFENASNLFDDAQRQVEGENYFRAATDYALGATEGVLAAIGSIGGPIGKGIGRGGRRLLRSNLRNRPNTSSVMDQIATPNPRAVVGGNMPPSLIGETNYGGETLLRAMQNRPRASVLLGNDEIVGGGFTDVKSQKPIVVLEHQSIRMPDNELTVPENINIEDLQGSTLHAIVGDNTGRHIVTGVGGQRFENPIHVGGGFQYIDRTTGEIKQGYAGAPSATMSKMNAANATTNPKYVSLLMGDQSSDFALHTDEIYGEMFRNAPIAKANVPKIDEAIRNIGMQKTIPKLDANGKKIPNKNKDGFLTKSITIRPFKNFNTIAEPNAITNYFKSLPAGGQRAAFLKGLDRSTLINSYGVPRPADARLAATDFDQVNMDWGTVGYRVFEPDLKKGMYTTTPDQSTTYTGGIDRIGNSQTLLGDSAGIPANLLFRNKSEAMRKKGTGGNLLLKSADYKGYESSPKTSQQLIEQIDVDTIGKFLEAEKTYGRKAAINFANQLLSAGKVTNQLIKAAKRENAPAWLIGALGGASAAASVSNTDKSQPNEI
jgi:hypothetical protein